MVELIGLPFIFYLKARLWARGIGLRIRADSERLGAPAINHAVAPAIYIPWHAQGLQKPRQEEKKHNKSHDESGEYKKRESKEHTRMGTSLSSVEPRLTGLTTTYDNVYWYMLSLAQAYTDRRVSRHAASTRVFQELSQQDI